MTFSYDPTRLDLPKNQLRLQLGADGLNPEVFQDEELDYFLSKNNTDLNWALYDCYKTCAVKYSSAIGDSLKIGDIIISEGKSKTKYYLDLAQELKNAILNGELPDYNPYIYIGGVSAMDSKTNDLAQAHGLINKSFSNPISFGLESTKSKYPRVPYSDYEI